MDLQTIISRRNALKMGAASAATLALAACGGTGSSSSSGPTTLEVWVWAAAPLQMTAFNAVKAAFPDDFKNVSLKVTTVGSGDQDVAQQLSLSMAARKNIPDFLMLNYTEVAQFAEPGMLADLSSAIGGGASGLYAGAQQLSQYKNTYVTVPWQLNSKLFYYRADLFEQAGINVDSITTAADFIAAGQTFHQKFPRQYLMNVNTQPAGYLFQELFSSYPNISMTDSSGKYQLTTNPGFAEALSFMKELRTSGIAAPIDDFTTDWAPAIKNETVCGFLIASWMKQFLPGYATATQVGKWKAKTWPSLFTDTDQSYGSDSGGSVIVVPALSPHKDLALNYLNKLRMDPKGSLAVFNATGVPPILKSTQAQVLSAINSQKKPDSMSQDDWLALPQNFFGQDYYATEFASYDLVRKFNYDPAALKEFTILEQWGDKIMQGDATVAAALAGAQNDMQSQIGNPYQQ